MKGEQLTKQAFEDMFWDRVQMGVPMVQAFHEINNWHLLTYGEERYSSYYSFAAVRDRKNRK